MPKSRFFGIPEPGCECGAACDSAHYARAAIYRVSAGRGAELSGAFDGYLCANCGRVWAEADPDYYGKSAAIGQEYVGECDGGRDPWTLH